MLFQIKNLSKASLEIESSRAAASMRVLSNMRIFIFSGIADQKQGVKKSLFFAPSCKRLKHIYDKSNFMNTF